MYVYMSISISLCTYIEKYIYIYIYISIYRLRVVYPWVGLLLYSQSAAVLDLRTSRGQTALHLAAAAGNTEEVIMLLRAGAGHSRLCIARLLVVRVDLHLLILIHMYILYKSIHICVFRENKGEGDNYMYITYIQMPR